MSNVTQLHLTAEEVLYAAIKECKPGDQVIVVKICKSQRTVTTFKTDVGTVDCLIAQHRLLHLADETIEGVNG